MIRNRLREIWQGGGTALNGWLSVPDPFPAEIMARQAWDSLTIDMQHGAVDYQAALRMLTAIATSPAVPVVRVPWLDPAHLMKALDAGALGIICPMINTAEDAARFVAWTSYPPDGVRSFGPLRANLYHGPDYYASANRTIVRFAMVETRAALDNLDAILATPGLDAVYVGPSDLSLSLGCRPRLDGLDADAEAAVRTILDKVTAAGLVPGIHTGSIDGALTRVDQGWRFVSTGNDAGYIAQGAAATVAAMRARLGPGPGGRGEAAPAAAGPYGA